MSLAPELNIYSTTKREHNPRLLQHLTKFIGPGACTLSESGSFGPHWVFHSELASYSRVFHVSTLTELHRSLEFYESGCTGKDSSGADNYIGGSNTDELWCIAVDISHNVVATNIIQENMEVTLFSHPLCEEGTDIKTFTAGGCQVIGEEADWRV
ncbi:hypothetical protein PG990_004159 [Apiospora arundinis]